jgi:hypothetical protein
MKKVFFILIAICLCAGLSAQKREGNVITVQGHPHELLTKQAAEGKGVPQAIQSPQATAGSVYNIVPSTVTCTVGCTTLDPTMSNPTVKTAYLMIKWTDGKASQRGTNDSILIWRYQWVSQYTHPVYGTTNVSKSSIDMIRAVANFDARFSALLQNTGGGNFTAGGFGYNFQRPIRVPVQFNLDSAIALSKRDTIHFHYDSNPNCLAPYNQFVRPMSPDPGTLVSQAITASSNTGVIKHPLDAAYSYPAYDYDFWTISSLPEYQWQAGWNYNYWSFNVRQGLEGQFTYPTTSGIATELLDNNTVHYFVFASANYNIPVNLDGYYSNPTCTQTACQNCGF